MSAILHSDASDAYAHSDSNSEIEAIENETNTKKKVVKDPTSETDLKKLSTKDMIKRALTDLNTKKGVSLYAIKKYISENFNVDTGRKNTIIKKQLKSSVEAGDIKQMKGVGASGSFKLIVNKEDKKKIEKETKLPKQNEKPSKKQDNMKTKQKSEETKEKGPKDTKVKKGIDEKQVGKVAKKVKETSSNVVEEIGNKKKKTSVKKKKMAELSKTSPKKPSKSVLKRKSIGSIIKTPKMKPKKRA